MAVTWAGLWTSDEGSKITHEFSVEQGLSAGDLCAVLERTAGLECAEIVLSDRRTGAELYRTGVEGACNWEHLAATFDEASRSLQVTVRLLPPSSEDVLVQRAVASGLLSKAAAQAAETAPAAAAALPASLEPEQPAQAAVGRRKEGKKAGSKAAQPAAGQAAKPEAAQPSALQAAPPAKPANGDMTLASSSSGSSMETALSDLPAAEEEQQQQEGGSGDAAVRVEVQAGKAKASTGGGEAAAAAAPAVAPRTPELTADEDAAAPAASAEPSAQQQGEAAAADGAGEAAATAAQKKKKKKKKKKKGGAAVAAGAAEDGEEEGEDTQLGGEGEQAGQEPAAAAAVQLQAQAAEAVPAAAKQKQEPAGPAGKEAGGAAEEVAEETEAAAAPAAPAILGWTELGKEVAVSQFSGLSVREALSKDRKKDSGGGEDQWLIKPTNAWGLKDAPGEVPFSAFGVFDGHGGRQVATFASNNLLKAVMAEVDASSVPLQEVPEVEGLGEEEAAAWRLHATLMARLPQACTAAFQSVDADAQRRWPSRGGTTATLALVVGWELLVANVGDSCAYLDTGAEVLQVSGNHRLADNKEEVARCLAAGHEVAPSSVDGKPAGPIRVWPGGLNMARTLGDAEAGAVVTAEPEICQVTLPTTGGRLIIGSDGLWDAIHPKTAAHHCRDMPAAEAAHRLLALAIKKDRLKDDVTVVVVDFLPNPAARLPPAFTLHRPSGDEQPAHLAHVWHPLREKWDWVAAGAERRRQALAEQRALEEEQAAEEARARERQQDAANSLLKQAAASGITAENLHTFDGMSDLHRELANLRLSPQDLAASLQRARKEHEREREEERRREMEGEWETVGEDKAAEQPEGRPGRHQHQEGYGGGQGRGRGRHGGRDARFFEARGGGGRFGGRGRGRGRGRGERHFDSAEGADGGAQGQPEVLGQEEQWAPASPREAGGFAAQPEQQEGPAPAEFRGGPGRGRGPGGGRGRGGASFGRGRGRGRDAGGRFGGPPAANADGAPFADGPAPQQQQQNQHHQRQQQHHQQAAPGSYVPPEASAATASLYFRPPPAPRQGPLRRPAAPEQAQGQQAQGQDQQPPSGPAGVAPYPGRGGDRGRGGRDGSGRGSFGRGPHPHPGAEGGRGRGGRAGPPAGPPSGPPASESAPAPAAAAAPTARRAPAPGQPAKQGPAPREAPAGGEVRPADGPGPSQPANGTGHQHSGPGRGGRGRGRGGYSGRGIGGGRRPQAAGAPPPSAPPPQAPQA